MKRLLKKNQMIITALAILIAIAGYLNYSEKNYKENKKAKLVNGVVENETVKDDIKNATIQDDIGDETNKEEIIDETNNEEIIDEYEIGDAILTNAPTFSANAKLQREQARAKNKETLMGVLESDNITEEQRNDITNELIHMTEINDEENEIETLLEAKGFSGAVVTISDNNIDVVINLEEITDNDRAVIEDVITRKTGMDISNIVITPIS